MLTLHAIVIVAGCAMLQASIRGSGLQITWQQPSSNAGATL